MKKRAAARARQLCDDNALRQELERKIIDDITAKLAADPAPLRQRVLVVAGADYHPGVIGIVASHLVERYGKPTVVLDMKADGTACGSARSIEGFDLYRAVSACSHVLTRFGGHPMAAGYGLGSGRYSCLCPSHQRLCREGVSSYAGFAAASGL